jgi:hypothetical protein
MENNRPKLIHKSLLILAGIAGGAATGFLAVELLAALGNQILEKDLGRPPLAEALNIPLRKFIYSMSTAAGILAGSLYGFFWAKKAITPPPTEETPGEAAYRNILLTFAPTLSLGILLMSLGVFPGLLLPK